MSGIRLQDRDRKIIEHLRRYRIATPEVLHSLFFPDAGRDAVKKVAARLEGNYIHSRPLYGKRVYYQLTASAARKLGEPEEVARPLGRQALPTTYGVLAFCCLGKARRKRFTRREFEKRFPMLTEAGLPFNDYYLDTYRGTTRLGRIIVDLGGDYQRLIRKLRSIVRQGMDLRPFMQLVDEQRFAFAVVTLEESKRQAIQDSLVERPLGVWLRVEVVPEIHHILEGTAAL